MRVVVLGGGGFVGAHVVAHYARRGDDVLAVDIAFPNTRREWWSQANTTLMGDLRCSLPSTLLASADRVFHLAADMGGVGYFHSDADPLAAAGNMRIDLNVLQACRDARVPFFYACSACALPESDRPLHEGLLGLGPADRLYGEEKRFMAMLLTQEPLARVGIFHTIYGPGQEAVGRRAKFPPAICRKVREGGVIEVWGDGSQMRTFLYVDDAIEKIVAVAEHSTYEGPVNIGSDEEVTVRQCADWLCEHAGIKPRYKFRPDEPTGVSSRGCDNRLYDWRYGRQEVIPARDGLTRLYEWIA